MRRCTKHLSVYRLSQNGADTLCQHAEVKPNPLSSLNYSSREFSQTIYHRHHSLQGIQQLIQNLRSAQTNEQSGPSVDGRKTLHRINTTTIASNTWGLLEEFHNVSVCKITCPKNLLQVNMLSKFFVHSMSCRNHNRCLYRMLFPKVITMFHPLMDLTFGSASFHCSTCP
jgi:hypothetical protein